MNKEIKIIPCENGFIVHYCEFHSTSIKTKVFTSKAELLAFLEGRL